MPKATKSSAIEPTAGEDGRIQYRVTETAPSRVACQRVKAGDAIRLTEDQARAELIALHIEPVSTAASEGGSNNV